MADFVFNLAGVNRPKDNAEFMQGNFGFGSKLLDTLKKHGNKAPVMLSSSIQATLIGRYGESDYGKSKLAGEELFFRYGEENGVKIAVYRFPNLMGHSRPNYNSADEATPTALFHVLRQANRQDQSALPGRRQLSRALQAARRGQASMVSQ